MHHGALAHRLSNQPIGSVTVKRGDEILDGPYPKSFAEFVGQDIARAQILAGISSAALRHTRLDHMLLDSGTPGIGKTSLARLAAFVRGVGFVELGGLVTDKDVAKALRAMQDGDILFLDEIHRLVARGKAKAEWLLTLMQDGVLHLPTGVVEAPNITVVGATTDGQKLSQAILDRFYIRPVLVPYTDSEALDIARLTAKRNNFGGLLPMPEDDAWLVEVAKASDNNPRRMGVLLASIRDSALAGLATEGQGGYDIGTALKWNGLTPDGLDTLAQEYLLGLYSYGGTAGISTLKALLNTDELKHTEDALIRRGFVQVTGKGRELSDYGEKRVKELVIELRDKMALDAVA